MNKEQNIQKMKDTLEKLRAEKYSDIPSELLDELLNKLTEDMGNQEMSSNGVREVLNNYFFSE